MSKHTFFRKREMTRTEALGEAEKTRAREIDREERNLLYNIRQARQSGDRNLELQARQSYEVWCKHVKFGGGR